MARIAIRTGISPVELLDTPMPVLAAIVAHLTGHGGYHDDGPSLDEVAVPR